MAEQINTLQNKTNNDKQSGNSKEITSIYIYMRSRTNNLFQGEAYSLTSINDTGEFDILPFHANFITLIKDFITIDKGLTSEKKFHVKSAVLSAIGSKVDVYVEA